MRFSGVQLVPGALAPLLRGVFMSRGFAPSVVADDGSVDADALLGLAYDHVRIETNLTDPIDINLRDPSSGATSALMQDLQPVITFSGPAGQIEYAPAGHPGGLTGRLKQAGALGILGIGAGIVGLLILGRAFGK